MVFGALKIGKIILQVQLFKQNDPNRHKCAEIIPLKSATSNFC